MTLEPLSRSEDGIAADRSWFDDSPLPMWICDVDTLGFLEVNGAALDHYGYTREEFVARKVFDLHRPGNHSGREPIAMMSRGFRCSITRKDGSVLPLEIACSPIRYAERAAFFAIVRDAEPVPSGDVDDSPRMVGTIQDVTGSTRLRPVSAEPTGASSLSEVSPVGIFHASPDGRCDYVNASYCEMSGLCPDEAIGDGWTRAIHSADRERVVSEWRLAVHARRPFRTECRLTRSNRPMIWVVAQAVPRCPEFEGQGGYLGTITDITDRKHAEEALEQERRRLQVVFDCTQDAILLADDEMRCVDVNPAACALLGCSRDEIVGHDIETAMPREHRADAGASRRFLERGRLEGEFELVRKDGSRCPVEYSAVANVTPGLHLTALRDISTRSTSQAMLRTHARHQAALAALAQMALAGMDHAALIDEATRRSAEALEADHGTVMEFIAGSDALTVRSEFIDGVSAPRARERVAIGSEYSPKTNDPVLISNLRRETRFRPDPRLLDLGLTSGIRVLIPGRENAFGVLAIHAHEPRTFTQDDVHFLQSVAHLVALAGIRMNEQEMRNRLLGRIVAARDEERQRLARELHDETGQSLTALLVGLVSVEQSRTIDETRALAMQLRQITARTIEDVGRLARGLHPSILTDMGLAEAARRHVADFQRSCGIPVQLRIRGLDGPRLRSRLETTCYRVLQEALTNCARHSQASQVRVGLFRSGPEVVLVLRDDGVGFDIGSQLASVSSRSGLGLHGMRERVARAGGIMTIDSAPHAGTRLIVRIPVRPIRMADHRTESHKKDTEASA
jgi:PAS domain S-box-containing protein